jgi:hypothetical protein
MDTGHVDNYNGDDNGLEILDGVEGVSKQLRTRALSVS